MSAHEALSAQQFGEATDVVKHLVSSDPETYWRVSPPQQGAHVEPLRGGYAAYKTSTGPSTADDKVDIGGLVAQPGAKGIARQALAKADQRYPTRHQTLDAFDGRLTGIYSHLGFHETSRVPFDEQYAPPGWKPEYGRPDVVFMQRTPAQPALFEMEKTPRKRQPRKTVAPTPRSQQQRLF